MVGKQISVTATAIGQEFSSYMKLAVLQLMTALFLYGNVNTSFLILQRNVSARMECWSLAVANTSSLDSHKTTRSRGHGKLYLSTRFPHTSNGGNRRLQDIATLMFKVKHSLVPANISDLFILKNTQYNLWNSDFELPRFETVRFGRNSIKYMGPLISWELPRHLRMIETPNLFKRNIRKDELSTLVNILTFFFFRFFNKFCK